MWPQLTWSHAQHNAVHRQNITAVIHLSEMHFSTNLQLNLTRCEQLTACLMMLFSHSCWVLLCVWLVRLWARRLQNMTKSKELQSPALEHYPEHQRKHPPRRNQPFQTLAEAWRLHGGAAGSRSLINSQSLHIYPRYSCK